PQEHARMKAATGDSKVSLSLPRKKKSKVSCREIHPMELHDSATLGQACAHRQFSALSLLEKLSFSSLQSQQPKAFQQPLSCQSEARDHVIRRWAKSLQSPRQG